MSGNAGTSSIYRFHSDGWTEERALRRPRTITHHIAAWTGDRALLLRAPLVGGRLQASAGLWLQIAGEPAVRRSNPALLLPRVLRTLADGSIVLAGEPWADLGHEQFAAGVERWGPHDQEGTVESLPGAMDGVIYDLCLVAADRTIVVGDVESQWTAWFHDGTRWTSERLPEGTTHAACAEDGSVFAVVGGTVQRRGAPGRWELLTLPETDPPLRAILLWAGASGALWAEASGGGREQWTLLRMPLLAAR